MTAPSKHLAPTHGSTTAHIRRLEALLSAAITGRDAARVDAARVRLMLDDAVQTMRGCERCSGPKVET